MGALNSQKARLTLGWGRAYTFKCLVDICFIYLYFKKSRAQFRRHEFSLIMNNVPTSDRFPARIWTLETMNRPCTVTLSHTDEKSSMSDFFLFSLLVRLLLWHVTSCWPIRWNDGVISDVNIRVISPCSPTTCKDLNDGWGLRWMVGTKHVFASCFIQTVNTGLLTVTNSKPGGFCADPCQTIEVMRWEKSQKNEALVLFCFVLVTAITASFLTHLHLLWLSAGLKTNGYSQCCSS